MFGFLIILGLFFSVFLGFLFLFSIIFIVDFLFCLGLVVEALLALFAVLGSGGRPLSTTTLLVFGGFLGFVFVFL